MLYLDPPGSFAHVQLKMTFNYEARAPHRALVELPQTRGGLRATCFPIAGCGHRSLSFEFGGFEGKLEESHSRTRVAEAEVLETRALLGFRPFKPRRMLEISLARGR